MCAIASIFLNIAALGAAAAIGTRQLWNDGASDPASLCFSYGLIATLPSMYLSASALWPAHSSLPPTRRTQATERQRPTARRLRSAKP
eukprot:399732-Pleurochrysis_carterae.AAC.1